MHLITACLANESADSTLVAHAAHRGRPGAGERAPLVDPTHRLTVIIGALFISPLIVIYPMARSYGTRRCWLFVVSSILLRIQLTLCCCCVEAPGVPLGVVNALLHGCLTIGWGMQWYGLEKVCVAYGQLPELSLGATTSTKDSRRTPGMSSQSPAPARATRSSVKNKHV